MTPPDFDAQKAAHAELVAATIKRAQNSNWLALSIVEQADAIRVAFAAGIAPHEIARVTGMSRTRIYEIRDGK